MVGIYTAMRRLYDVQTALIMMKRDTRLMVTFWFLPSYLHDLTRNFLAK